MARFLADNLGLGIFRRSSSQDEHPPPEVRVTRNAPVKQLSEDSARLPYERSPRQQQRRHLSVPECDPPPDLDADSEVLRQDDVFRLLPHLPPRLVGAQWKLAYSSARDGFSLATLYRKMPPGPALIAIKDTADGFFGALVAAVEGLRPSARESFYGTGETFLFRLRPEFRVWKWTTQNDYFVSCGIDNLLVGSGEGRFGLALDADLNVCRTQSCATFGNEPLTPAEDFVVHTLEVWTFE